jgi:uncharacterized protein
MTITMMRLSVAVLGVLCMTLATAKVVVTDNPVQQVPPPNALPGQQPSPQQGYQFAPDTVPGPNLPGLAQEAPRKRSAAPARRVSAQLQLGLARLHGINMPQDLKEAGKDFMLAHAKGDPQAPAAVALCHLMGCYGTPDRRSVALWIDRTRAREPAKARLLEWASFEQFAPADRFKLTRSAALLQAAARALDPVALNEQGLQQVTANQRQAATTSFSQAAERGSAAAARNLELLAQSQSNRASNAGAANATSRSAEPAPAPLAGQAAFELAQRYHAGQGLPINYIQAVQYYKQAADAGHLQAKRMIELIFSRRTAQGTLDDVWMRQLAPGGSVSATALGSNGMRAPSDAAPFIVVATPPSPFMAQSPAVWLQKDISLLADWMPLDQ